MAQESLSSSDIAPWAPSSAQAGTRMRYRRGRWLLAAATLVLGPVLLWQVAVWSERAAVERLRTDGQHRMGLFHANLRAELSKYEHLPVLLSRDGELVRLLAKPEDARLVDWVNRRLEEFNSIARTSAIYLMDRDGLTIAASNWNTETAFVGKNFAFRPYFQHALAGRAGRYFALGTTSKEPGYYLAYPVSAAGQVLGVVVVKVGVGRIEDAWAASEDLVVVSDDDGVIFISSNPDWKFRTLAPLTAERKSAIANSRQYVDAPLTPLPVARRTPLDAAAATVRFNAPVGGGHDGRTFFVQSVTMPDREWTVHLFSDMRPLHRSVNEALLLTALGLLTAVMVAWMVLQRRAVLRERLDYQTRAQEALQRAHDTLERRVEERTTDLAASNVRLHAEIAERRRTEETLRQAQDELVQASKLAALGQMAAGITHELNQPLSAIRTYADNAGVLLERARTDAAKGNLAQIAQLCERMGRITGQLKLFSRKSDGAELVAVSLARAVADTLALLRSGRRLDGVTVDNRVAAGDVMVVGDMVRLEQVVLNLVRNALDAMSESAERRLVLEAVDNGATASLVVRDTGPGLAAGAAEHLFDPFFTTKPPGEGLGLGLSISQRIVGDFGGTLHAANHPDGGAVFTVTLRRARTEAPA